MNGEAYRKLANICRRRKLKLRLCGDRDHSHSCAPTRLTTIDIASDGELLVRVSLREHTLDSAALVALAALKKAGVA